MWLKVGRTKLSLQTGRWLEDAFYNMWKIEIVNVEKKNRCNLDAILYFSTSDPRNCYICDREFESSKEMKQRMRKQHMELDYKC